MLSKMHNVMRTCINKQVDTNLNHLFGVRVKAGLYDNEERRLLLTLAVI